MLVWISCCIVLDAVYTNSIASWNSKCINIENWIQNKKLYAILLVLFFFQNKSVYFNCHFSNFPLLGDEEKGRQCCRTDGLAGCGAWFSSAAPVSRPGVLSFCPRAAPAAVASAPEGGRDRTEASRGSLSLPVPAAPIMWWQSLVLAGGCHPAGSWRGRRLAGSTGGSWGARSRASCPLHLMPLEERIPKLRCLCSVWRSPGMGRLSKYKLLAFLGINTPHIPTSSPTNM